MAKTTIFITEGKYNSNDTHVCAYHNNRFLAGFFIMENGQIDTFSVVLDTTGFEYSTLRVVERSHMIERNIENHGSVTLQAIAKQANEFMYKRNKRKQFKTQHSLRYASL